MQVSVQGGTNAGWRTVKAQSKKDWTCPKCHSKNRFYWLNCPTRGCGTGRPDDE